MKEKFILLIRLLGILLGISTILIALSDVQSLSSFNENYDWLLLIVIPFELILGVALILPYFQIKNYRIRAINFTLGLGSGVLVALLLTLWFIVTLLSQIGRLSLENGQILQMSMVSGIFILLVILMIANFMIIYKKDLK